MPLFLPPPLWGDGVELMPPRRIWARVRLALVFLRDIPVPPMGQCGSGLLHDRSKQPASGGLFASIIISHHLNVR